MDFELINNDIEGWKDTDFIVQDFYLDDVALIMLDIDWNSKDARVDIWNHEDDKDVLNVRDGFGMVFELDTMTDMSKFKKYYDEEIRPIVNEMGNTFVVENGKGAIKGTEERGKYFFVGEIIDKIMKAPKHGKYIYFTVDEVFEYDGDLVEFLGMNGFDLFHVDLNDDNVLLNIREVLEKDCVILLDDVEFGEELREKKEYLLKDGF